MVFVLDKTDVSLIPCTGKRARLMLERGRAQVHWVYPFVFWLKDRLAPESAFQTLELKFDLGSCVVGLTLVRKTKAADTTTWGTVYSLHVLNLFELIHRRRQISEPLTQRLDFRRRRRETLRYHTPRLLNRGNRQPGWLAPSFQHRVNTTMTWVERLGRWNPVLFMCMEWARFYMLQMESPEVTGVEHQQGMLAVYKVRECLPEKWGQKCAHCGKEHMSLNIGHARQKAKGGASQMSNLTLACVPCNTKKCKMPVEAFLKNNTELLAKKLRQLKTPLNDAVAVNLTRLVLLDAIRAAGLPVSTSSGDRTKWSRLRLDIPKFHALDAVCVGEVSTGVSCAT